MSPEDSYGFEGDLEWYEKYADDNSYKCWQLAISVLRERHLNAEKANEVSETNRDNEGPTGPSVHSLR